MILNQKQTVLAYRCPSCGGVVTSVVGAFSLSASMFKLKCECSESFMTVEKLRDKKVRLTVPCTVCGKNHSYIISENVFFGSDIFVISCALSGVDICFIGTENGVRDAVNRSNEELMKMLGGASLESIKSKSKDPYSFTDPQVLEVVKYVINELDDEGKIYCDCKNGGEYNFEILDDCVLIKCEKCGCEAKIPTNSTLAAQNFLESDFLKLQ